MATIDRPHNREILGQLMEKASVQGYLTTDDLLDTCPELGEDAEGLSFIMLALRHRGVDMLDSDYDSLSMEGLTPPELIPWMEPEASDYTSDDSVGMYLKEMSRVLNQDGKPGWIWPVVLLASTALNGSASKPSCRMASWLANKLLKPIRALW